LTIEYAGGFKGVWSLLTSYAANTCLPSMMLVQVKLLLVVGTKVPTAVSTGWPSVVGTPNIDEVMYVAAVIYIGPSQLIHDIEIVGMNGDGHVARRYRGVIAW
jgi:hypothetical protein